MNIKRSGKKQKFDDRPSRGFGRQLQVKLFFSFAFTSTVILMAAFFIFYREASQMLLKQSSRDTFRQLEQVESFFGNLEAETMYIAQSLLLDYSQGKLLNHTYKSEYEKVMLTRELFEQIQEILDSYAYVDSVYYYGYDGTVLGMGRNYQRCIMDGMENVNFPGSWFYDSKFYSEMLQAVDSVNWIGGLSSQDFQFYSINENENYLSLLYRINIQYSNQVVMVINLKENYFSQLYAEEDIEDYHNRYVVSSDGKIISSIEKEQIGAMCAYDILHISDEDVILAEAGADGGQTQVVFGNLPGMHWTIVDEISVDWLKRDVNVLRKYIYYIALVSLVTSFGVSRFWIFRITAPLMRLTEKMRRTEKGHLGEKLDTAAVKELGVVGRQFNSMSESIVTLIDQNRRIEEEKRYYEMETLWQQINPHFIYNTLNIIKWMSVLAKADNITVCVEAFGNLLKPIFKRRQEEYSLREELSYINDYVKIMNYRYGKLLELTIECSESNMDYEIPRLILQPILENSILHGMRGAGVPLHLLVKVEVGEELLLTIQDDGRGMSGDDLRILKRGLEDSANISDEEKDKIGRTGIGMSNVCKRIRLLYGNYYGVQIDSKPDKGTRVNIWLPIREREVFEKQENIDTR